MSRIAHVVRRSNYLVTINCNVSFRKEMIDPEFSRRYRATMEYIGRELEFKVEELGMQIRHADYQNVDVKVLSWDFKLERGEKRKFLHLHGVLKLDNYCRIDEKKLQAWVSQILVRRGIRKLGGAMGVISSFRYFKDGEAIRKAYIGKGEKQRSLSPPPGKKTIDMYTHEELRKEATKRQLPGRSRASKAKLWSMLDPILNK